MDYRIPLLALLAALAAPADAGIGIGPVTAGRTSKSKLACPPGEALAVAYRKDDILIASCEPLKSMCGYEINTRDKSATDGRCRGNLTFYSELSHQLTKLDTKNAQATARLSGNCLRVQNPPRNFIKQECNTKVIELNRFQNLRSMNSILKIEGAPSFDVDDFEIGMFETDEKDEMKKRTKRAARDEDEDSEEKRKEEKRRRGQKAKRKPKKKKAAENKKILNQYKTKENHNYIKSITRIGNAYKVRYCWINCNWADNDSKLGKKTSRYGNRGPSRPGIRSVRRLGNQGQGQGQGPPKPKVEYRGQRQMGYRGTYKGDTADAVLCVTFPCCFPNEATVETPAGLRFMKDLRIGDHVKVLGENGLDYSPIRFFSHQNTKESATYVKIESENGKSIKISPRHLLFFVNCSGIALDPATGFVNEYFDMMNSYFQYAENVVPLESCLLTETMTAAGKRLQYDRVISAQVGREVGLIAPITKEGTIIVDSVLASVYANFESQFLQHSFYYNIYKLIDAYEWLATALFNAEFDKSDVPIGLRFVNGFMQNALPDLSSITSIS